MSKRCRKFSGVGGQAVLEGIMMKNKESFAVAVRKPNGEIEVEKDEFHGMLREKKIKQLPFIRGIFNFVDSLVLGMKTLTYSAKFYDEEEEAAETLTDKAIKKVFKEKAEKVIMGCTVTLSIVFAIGLFMVLPYFLSTLVQQFIPNPSFLALIEGVIRITIFVLYVSLISLMKDIKRVYQYHGAEHKCINCIERGRELTIANVMKSSKQHKRCGTSFMLFVMFVSIVFFFFIRVDNPVLRVVIRIGLLPIIAGISYELIRIAGKSDNIIIRIISAPGLWLQRLTTKEPDESMVEVAIVAVEAVFDWRQYLIDSFGYTDFPESGFEKEQCYEELNNDL